MLEEIKHTQQIQTQFLGNMEIVSSYKNENDIALTQRQKRIIKTFVDNHFKDRNFIITYYHVFVCKYFVALHIAYFPKDAHNTIYTQTRKTLWIGVKGAIKKFTVSTGIGAKERNVKKIYKYYIKAEDR